MKNHEIKIKMIYIYIYIYKKLFYTNISVVAKMCCMNLYANMQVIL